MTTPGPTATIALAALVGILGAVAVVLVDSTVVDVLGFAAVVVGLMATLWAALQMASDPHSSE